MWRLGTAAAQLYLSMTTTVSVLQVGAESAEGAGEDEGEEY
jgi:hypothetical protein